MGNYFNPNQEDYEMMFNSDIFVDKSELIQYTNAILNTSNRFICVSRPRRFGKSTDANMLVAYYSKGCNTHPIFDHLKISKSETYEKHLNQHNVIHLNMQMFLSKSKNIEEFISLLSLLVIRELKRIYKYVDFFDDTNLQLSLLDIYSETNDKFIFIVDEWDCLFRELRKDENAQRQYLNFLRDLFKDQKYVELVYMTGILPIKKYGTHSALNMFKEISMLNPTPLEEFMGFTEIEVNDLCSKYNMNFEKMKDWYDGYQISSDLSIYNHRSVVYALLDKKYENYWSQTETFEALQVYIDMNFDGLKDDIVKLLAGEYVHVNTNKFQNDMTTFQSKDDVLTLLIHLGYLGYDSEEEKCYIPNKEVASIFVNSIESSDWNETTKALLNSKALLDATWQKDEELVAKYIEEAHLDTSILTYNNENALSYTIQLAYITAKEHYTIIRELPTGKGFADIVFIPKGDKPAMIVELKWNQDVATAITQIKNKNYPKALESYVDNLLLVAINYDKLTKKHYCYIEKYERF